MDRVKSPQNCGILLMQKDHWIQILGTSLVFTPMGKSGTCFLFLMRCNFYLQVATASGTSLRTGSLIPTRQQRVSPSAGD